MSGPSEPYGRHVTRKTRRGQWSTEGAARAGAPRTGPFRTVEEVAEYLRTTPTALYTMRHRGEGPPAVKVGRKLLYAQSDLDAYLDRLYAEQAAG